MLEAPSISTWEAVSHLSAGQEVLLATRTGSFSHKGGRKLFLEEAGNFLQWGWKWARSLVAVSLLHLCLNWSCKGPA